MPTRNFIDHYIIIDSYTGPFEKYAQTIAEKFLSDKVEYYHKDVDAKTARIMAHKKQTLVLYSISMEI